MENKDNKQNSLVYVLSSYITLFVVLNACGFIGWAAYQVAIKQLVFLPSVSLLTGLCIWWLILLVKIVPDILIELYSVSVRAIEEQKKQDQAVKALEELTKSYSKMYGDTKGFSDYPKYHKDDDGKNHNKH